MRKRALCSQHDSEVKASETRLTYQGRVGFCVPYKLVVPTQYDGELERHLRRAVWLVSN